MDNMDYKITISKDASEFQIEATIKNNASVDFGGSGKGYDDLLKVIEKITLGDMSINKQIYTPNCVRLHLFVKPKGDKGIISTREILRDYLVDSTLSITLNKGETERLAVAEGYKVIELKYQSNLSQIALELLAYSPDKYATLDKHSQAFTGKTVDEILKDAIEKRFNCPYSVDNTLFLHYMMKESADSEEETRQYHRIPYAVQYNESTYDFIARLAKKHGEFLFFEDGRLRLGGQCDDNPVISLANKDIANISFEDSTLKAKTVYVGTNHLGAEEKELYKAFHPIDKSEAQSTGVNVVNQEYAGNDSYMDLKDGLTRIDNKEDEDSYLETPDNFALFDKNPYDLYDRDACIASNILGGLSDILSAKTYIDMGLAAGMKLKEATLDTYWNSKGINKGYLEGISKKEEYTDKKGKKKKKTVLLKGARYNDGPYGKEKLKYQDPFAFLSYITEASLQTKRDKISLELVDTFFDKNLKLGGHISLDKKRYMVTALNVKKVSEKLTEFPRVFLEVIPYTCVSKDGEGGTIPYFELSDLKRESSTQVAIVVDTQDPYRLNRVRVRYPWQFVKPDDSGNKDSVHSINYKLDGDDGRETLLDGATPWIRVATPAAKGGGGFIFTPEKFSEVLVNYENGNIERPYVESGVYRRTDDLFDAARNDENTSTLSSRYGQKIIFQDENEGLPFLTGLVGPLADLALGHILPNGVDGMEALNGSTEITDRYGVNSIKLETGGRNITIKSTMGDININALTGISIEAPNGDISIKGKNITISAGNELSLVSGTHIDRSMKASTSIFSVTSAVKVSAISMLNDSFGIDFGLMRTFLEAIFKPVGGTMVIKSNRNLCMEAGRGSAQISQYAKKNPLVEGNEVNAAGSAEPIKEPLLHFIRIFDNCRVALEEIEEKERVYANLYNSSMDGHKYCLDTLMDYLVDDKKSDIKREFDKILKPEAVEENGDDFKAVEVNLIIDYSNDLKDPDDADQAVDVVNKTLKLVDALNDYKRIKYRNRNKFSNEIAQIDEPLRTEVLEKRLFGGSIPKFSDLCADNCSHYQLVRQAILGELAAKRMLLLIVIQLMQEENIKAKFDVGRTCISLDIPNPVDEIFKKYMKADKLIPKMKFVEKVKDMLKRGHRFEIVCDLQLENAAALTPDEVMEINAAWRFIENNIFVEEELSWAEVLWEAVGIDGLREDFPYFVDKGTALDRDTLLDGSILFSDNRHLTYRYDSQTREFVTSDTTYDSEVVGKLKEVLCSLKEEII